MPVPESARTYRVRVPEVYERGRAHTSRLEVRAGGGLVAPSAAVFRLYSATGALVTSGNATIEDDSSLSYTVTADLLPSSLAYGVGWREEWACTFDGVVETATREASLARVALRCPVTQADLEALHPQLARTHGTTTPTLDGYRDEAWAETVRRLSSTGQWPERIVEPTSLVSYVRDLTLHYIFRAFSASATGVERYASLSEQYRLSASSAWSQVRFRQDSDQDGTADKSGDELRSPGAGSATRSHAPLVTGRRRLSRVL